MAADNHRLTTADLPADMRLAEPDRLVAAEARRLGLYATRCSHNNCDACLVRTVRELLAQFQPGSAEAVALGR